MRSTECNLRHTIGSSGRIVPVRHRSMHAKENRSVDNIGPPTASLRDRIMVLMTASACTTTDLPCAMPPSMNQSGSVDAT